MRDSVLAGHAMDETNEPSEATVADDAALVAAARHDRRAFAPLYDRYVGPIYRYCYGRIGNREAAEDATSATFTKAIGNLDRFRDGSFGAWLFAIAHNVVADGFRRAPAQQPLERAGELIDGAPSPEELALAAWDRRSLRALLDGLAADQRDVLELRLSGLSTRETAATLGRTEASVRSLQYRATARLRSQLTPPAGTEEANRGRV